MQSSVGCVVGGGIDGCTELEGAADRWREGAADGVLELDGAVDGFAELDGAADGWRLRATQ